MTFGPLSVFATGDLNYVAKMDSDNLLIAAAINTLQAAVASSSVSSGPFLTALLGVQTAFIGSTSYTHSETGTTMTLSAGWAWRPDIGQVVSKGVTSPLNFSGQSAGTYYIPLDAAGSPSISPTLTTPLYSVVWTGSAFGTITRMAPTVWNFEDWTLAQTSTALTKTFISLVARFEYDETLLAAVAVTPQTANKLYAGPASGAAAPPGFRASVVADLPFAGSALGVATLDGSGKVPVAQLPAAVTGSMDYAGTWNATTNTPTLVSGVGTKGTFYKTATAGSTTIDGINQWNIGDSIVFDGTTWDKIDGIANEVVTVAGKYGAVTLVVGDVSGAEASANKDVANGYAGLDSGGLLKDTEVPTTAVTPASYGDGTHVAQFTVDSHGRVTAAASVAITGAAPSGAAGGVLAGSYPDPGFASIADGDVMANVSGGLAAPIATTITAMLDKLLGTAQGLVMYRDASAWQSLATGTNGQFLQTQGASANPRWWDAAAVLNVKPTARLATTAALPANVYSNGSSGVGATLTGVSFGALSVDGVTPSVGDLILVKNEVAGANDGLYSVTTVGAVATLYVLTRQVDMNQAAEFKGVLVPVGSDGTANANSLWLCNPTGTVVVGTTSIPFTQLNGATDLLQGTGITIAGNTVSLAAIADMRLLANVSGGSAAPSANTLTAILDDILGSTRGMTLYRGASAWAALAAGTAGQFLQTQGTSGDPLWVSEPFDFSGFFSGLPTAAASKVMVSVPIARAVTFAANFAGCYLKLRGTTATASLAVDIQKNGSSIGTATIALGGSSATFTSSGGAAQTFAAGDLFALVLPATPDATADNMGWVFAGTR